MNMEALRKRLANDFNIPINFFDDEKFNYLKNLYDDFFKISEKEALLSDVIESLKNNGDKDYFEYAYSVNDKLKALVKNSEAYTKMNEFQNNKNEKEQNLQKQRIYIEPNINKRLLSVDLNKANFNSFKLFGLLDELNIKDYKDFVKLVTPYEYFQESRMTRQIVFGDLNPKKQQSVQKSIINEFAKVLSNKGLLLTSCGSDEIIIDPGNNDDVDIKFVLNTLKEADSRYDFYRVEEFSFTQIHPDKDYFFKTSVDSEGKVKNSFKNVPSNYFIQVFKHHFNMPIEDNDMLFQIDGHLAKYLERHLSENTPKPKIKW